jgi:hypothetical protein
MPEATLHCVMPWTAVGRTRRALMLRDGIQQEWQDRQSADLQVHPKRNATFSLFTPKYCPKTMVFLANLEIIESRI